MSEEPGETVETLPQIERIVKPRTNGHTHLPILIVRHDMVLSETSEVRPLAGIDWRLEKPSLVVGIALPAMVADLDTRYTLDPLFQWQATDKAGALTGTNVTVHRTIVTRFGWKASRVGGHREGHWHTCLDAQTFYVNPFTMDEHTDPASLLQWATDLRTFCADNNLAIRSTASAIAVQFLRDPRFYPDARRKVPRATNATGREQLPGNYYKVLVDERDTQTYMALEIDQTRAHHYHAEHTRLPDANSLMARGDFQQLKRVSDARSSRSDTFSGLYYMRLSYNGKTTGLQCPDNFFGIRDNGRCFDAFVWSCELPFLRDSGYSVHGILASWGSWKRDECLRLYSRHSQYELDKWNNAHWLKPILLATYGLLAVRPSAPTTVLRTAKSDVPASLVTSREWLHGYLVQHTQGREIEPEIANVLQRGIIEAATRVESIGMAQWLEANNVKVLQIYADCVIVEDDLSQPLPLIPDPWRVKDRLTDYRPLHAQAYISVEKERLPGVSKRDRLAISRNGGTAPARHYTEALSGRRIGRLEQEKTGLPLRRV